MPDYKKLLAELFGAYILLAMGGFAIASTGLGIDGSLVIPLGFGLGLMVGLYMFGEVSGGHYNPAVSLAMLLDKRIDVVTFGSYVVSQIVGFILAGLTLVYAFGRNIAVVTVTQPNPTAGVSNLDAVLLEALGTAIFVGVILRVTKSDKFSGTAFIAIGLTLATVAIAFGGFTGGSFNPGRSIGSAVVGGEYASLWVYIVGPLLGGVVAWLLYTITSPSDDDGSVEEVMEPASEAL